MPDTVGASPARLLEMRPDRFGAFESIACSTIKLARHVPQDELTMDLLVADAVLEFGDGLRAARESVAEFQPNRMVHAEGPEEPELNSFLVPLCDTTLRSFDRDHVP